MLLKHIRLAPLYVLERESAIPMLLSLGVMNYMHTPRKQSSLFLAPEHAPRLHVPTQPPVTDPLALPAVRIPALPAMATPVGEPAWPLMFMQTVQCPFVARLASPREIPMLLARCSTVPPAFLILVPLALEMV